MPYVRTVARAWGAPDWEHPPTQGEEVAAHKTAAKCPTCVPHAVSRAVCDIGEKPTGLLARALTTESVQTQDKKVLELGSEIKR